MKTFVVLLFVVLVMLAFAAPVLAQEPPASPPPTPVGDQPPTFELPKQLPATATEGLEVVRAFLVFVSSLAAIYVTGWIKALPGLGADQKAKLSGLGADAVAGLTAVIMGIVMAYGAIAAGFLDNQGFWTVLKWALASWPTTWVMYRSLKLTA